MEKKIKRPPGRPPKSASSNSQTEPLLLQTAAALFMEKGYERVSLEHIAELCQVTKAMVYYYFSSKSVLFTRSVIHVLDRVQELTRKLLAEPGTLKERLTEIAHRHLSVYQTDFGTMMKEAEAHLTQEQIAAIRQAEQGIHNAMAEEFLAAAGRGELKPMPAFFLSHAFSSLLLLGNRLPPQAQATDPLRTAQALVELFLEGAENR